MRAGVMRQRVAIEQATESRDAHGGVTRTWTAYATRWASIEPMQGRELFEAQQVKSNVTHKVRLRHLDGITESMVVKHLSRTLNIESIINTHERNAETVLLCTERANGAG